MLFETDSAVVGLVWAMYRPACCCVHCTAGETAAPASVSVIAADAAAVLFEVYPFGHLFTRYLPIPSPRPPRTVAAWLQ